MGQGMRSGFLACCVITIVCATICVPLRCYARLKIISRLTAEDYLLVAGYLLFLAVAGMGLYEIGIGLGSDENEDIPLARIKSIMKVTFIGAIVYAADMLLIRLSISLLLLRLAANRWQKIIIFITIGVLFLSCTMFMYWSFTICSPYWRFWERTYTGGNCRPLDQVYDWAFFLNSAGAIFTDFTLAILPMWILYRSKLSTKVKMAMSVILGLGVFASIAVVMRLYQTRHLDNTWKGFLNNLGLVLTWSVAEIGLAITAASCATFRSLFVSTKSRTLDDDGTRGRTGRPPQPGDTKVEWDPGLTIGYISHAHIEDDDCTAVDGDRTQSAYDSEKGKSASRSFEGR